MAEPEIARHSTVIEHVTIFSRRTFDAVQGALKTLIPVLDQEILKRLHPGETEQALRRMEAAPELSIFTTRDHGSLLAIAGIERRAAQYEIGNPLTASKMTRHQISAALYAPVRVLLREDHRGVVAFEYDRPGSSFGQFNDDEVNAVAHQLDLVLEARLLAAAY
jgi:uncharacterized protein (DUF302 family)